MTLYRNGAADFIDWLDLFEGHLVHPFVYDV